jgi:predicted SnoaL-like aldol condensation-catalyzing enzyme
MPALPLSRRAAIAAALALPAAAAAVTKASAQSGSDASSVDLVRRWAEEVVRPLQPQFGDLAHPDLVMELHGAGGNADGTPRVLNGRPAVVAWFEQVKAQHATPVSVRIDQMVAQGDTVAVRSENNWTLRGEGESQQRRVKTIAAFFKVQDGKIAHIWRFSDRVPSTQT